jgi:lysozyme
MLDVVIDLSHYNNGGVVTIDFGAVAGGGVSGVIHKATQGTSVVDPAYAARRPAALAAGLLWGAYHFGSAADGAQQADFFLRTVDPAGSDLLVLDLEATYDASGQQTASMSLAQAEAFVTHVNQQTGRWPALYGGSYLKSLLGSHTDTTLARCWLWIAEYTSAAAPSLPTGWPTWTLWQYTESGSVPGITGAVDRDRFNGSELAQLVNTWLL